MHPALHPWPTGRIWPPPPRGSATGLMRVRRLAQVGARSSSTFPNPAQVSTGAETDVRGLDKTQLGRPFFAAPQGPGTTPHVSPKHFACVIASSALAIWNTTYLWGSLVRDCSEAQSSTYIWRYASNQWLRLAPDCS